MARFNFGKRSPDDEGIPPEPIEGETDVGGPSDLVGGGNRMRRPLIFALIGALLIGGVYLANVLFFSAPPAPTIPARPAVPVPPAAAHSRASTIPVPPVPAAVPKQPEAGRRGGIPTAVGARRLHNESLSSREDVTGANGAWQGRRARDAGGQGAPAQASKPLRGRSPSQSAGEGAVSQRRVSAFESAPWPRRRTPRTKQSWTHGLSGRRAEGFRIRQ
jgi:hypothetical protein